MNRKNMIKKLIALVIALTFICSTVVYADEANDFSCGAESETEELTALKDEAISLFDDTDEEYVSGELLVTVSDNADEENIAEEIETIDLVKSAEVIDYSKTIVVKLSKKADISDAIEEIFTSGEILSIEPDYIIDAEDCLDSTSYGVNDTYASYEDYLGTIKVQPLWNYIKKNGTKTQTNLFIIDSGCNPNVTELSNTVDWENSVSVAYVSQSNEYVKLTDLKSPDPVGHGTAVTSLCVAEANNNKGMAGVASAYSNEAVKATVVAICDEDKNITIGSEIRLIAYAIENGADVINMSWGNTKNYTSFHSIIEEAYDKGIILVAAAGNNEALVSVKMNFYPASYDEVISVASVNSKKISSCATDAFIYNDQIFVSAPGINIFTIYGNSYSTASGTSFSAPMVASVAALLHSINPKFTTAKMKKILKASATDIKNGAKVDGTTKGYDTYTGYGLLNAKLATHYAVRYGKTKFDDVKNINNYYYNTVYWGSDNSIVSAYSDGTFGVGKNVTKIQMIKMLWKAAGKPKASGTVKFTDCKKYKTTSATYKAILWAQENGIIKATSGNKLNPDSKIKVKDVIVMLYRLSGKPKVTGTSSYSDIKSLKKSSERYKAFLWAENNKMLKGYIKTQTDGTAGSTSKLTKEQAITFLYNYFEQ